MFHHLHNICSIMCDVQHVTVSTHFPVLRKEQNYYYLFFFLLQTPLESMSKDVLNFVREYAT